MLRFPHHFQSLVISSNFSSSSPQLAAPTRRTVSCRASTFCWPFWCSSPSPTLSSFTECGRWRSEWTAWPTTSWPSSRIMLRLMVVGGTMELAAQHHQLDQSCSDKFQQKESRLSFSPSTFTYSLPLSLSQPLSTFHPFHLRGGFSNWRYRKL